VAVGREGLAGYAATARRVLLQERARNLPQRLRGREERLVFVVGSPRSGTTFLAGAIGAVPGFADLTEVTPLKAAIPSLARAGEADAAARIRAILERVRTMTLVRGVRGVEQTPETAFVLAAALRAYPEARAVHVVRDGRDVACSLLERGWLSAGRAGADDARRAYGADARFWVREDEREEFERSSDAARAAWAWRAYVTAARSVEDRVLEVRYESLASSAPDIARHLGADAAPLEATLSRFTDRSIGRFRRDLSPEQLADVEGVAGPLLRELGYAGGIHERLLALLRAEGVEFRLTHHDAVTTSAEAAAVRGAELRSGAKAMLVKTRSGFVLAVLAADRKVDWKRLAPLVGDKGARFANDDELRAATGLSKGAVPPFGSLFGLRTVYDESLMDVETVNFNAGSHTDSITMAREDLVRVGGGEVAAFAAA